jgi:hypothetical protein
MLGMPGFAATITDATIAIRNAFFGKVLLGNCPAITASMLCLRHVSPALTSILYEGTFSTGLLSLFSPLRFFTLVDLIDRMTGCFANGIE